MKNTLKLLKQESHDRAIPESKKYNKNTVLLKKGNLWEF